MILKLTICGLSILLVAVITLSYHMNEEGFATTTAATANPALTIGQSVRCEKPSGRIGFFRYTAENTLQSYVTNEIAASWDENYKSAVVLPDCSAMTFGDNLGRKNAANSKIENPPQKDSGASQKDSGASVKSSSASSSASSSPPHVHLSDIGYTAMSLQEKSDILKDIKKMVKNEILANRSMDDNTKNCQSMNSVTDSTAQGQEYESTSMHGLHAKDSCGSVNGVDEHGAMNGAMNGTMNSACNHDMSQYIKKDSIPCWGCSLDY